MSSKKRPSISIVIPTFNSERTLDLCLAKVTQQIFDKKRIEIIIADGGSRDSTLEIAKKFGAKIVKVDPRKQNAEYNKGVGFRKAKNEIVLFLDHDNIMPHSQWLNKITQPFVEDEEIFGVEPLRFHYDKSMTVLDRYFALFGGSDPVVYYLGKTSHLSYSEDKYTLFGTPKTMRGYYKIKFTKKKIPALGGNGAALKRDLLIKYAKSDPDNFIHTDVVADLIRAGFNEYAIIKDTIIHLTNNKVFPFLSRRKYFIEKYQLEDAFKRRYYIYDPRTDRVKLLKYIISSLTFIIPLKDSFKGFLKVHDIAWFLHPFMCFAFLIIYSIPVFKGGAKSVILGK